MAIAKYDRTIRVILSVEGSDLADSPSSDIDDGNDAASSLKSSGNNEKSKFSKGMRGIVTSRYLRRAATTAVSLATDMINSYFSLEENYKAQIDVQNASQIISDATSLVMAGVASATTGNPMPMITATARLAISKGKQVFQSYSNEAESLAEKAYGKQYKAAALGLIDGSRGTEN